MGRVKDYNGMLLMETGNRKKGEALGARESYLLHY